MNPNLGVYFNVPDQLVGKTLNQIGSDPTYNVGGVGAAKFDPNEFSGVGLDTPLTKGQQLNYHTDDPGYKGSGQYMTANSLFGSPITPEQKAVQPAVDSLQASKAPLQQRYTDLISQIKGEQGIAENRQTVSTNNELARRGITGGGVYDQEFANALNPVTQNYTSLIKNAGDQQNVDLNSVDQAIAQLQAGAGNSSISNALQQQQFQSQQNLAQQGLDLQKQQQSYGQNYITIPGIGVYDLAKGQLVGNLSNAGLSGGGYSILGVQ